MSDRPRILFVTGKLAAPGLRRVVEPLAASVPFDAEVAVLPITVAALLTTDWVSRHLTVPSGITKIVLPGLCRGEMHPLAERFGIPVERGPKDFRDLPEHFGKRTGPPIGYGEHAIDILAEINHAPTLTPAALLAIARRYQHDGADFIDLGCDPATTWAGVGDCVRALRGEGMRVSIDSFNAVEVDAALDAGAELVLSINGSNLADALRRRRDYPHVEYVAIPDRPDDAESLDRTIHALGQADIRFRIDPILEPIGFGFAASLGRYLRCRERYPDVPMLMGVGNLTELTDVDSAGINVLLAGFCAEQRIGSVLTTQVIPWCASAVREFDLARKLVHYAVREGRVPKRLEPNLVMLRDPKLHALGEEALQELAEQITDRNYRLFAERGELFILNDRLFLRGTDPFTLFAELRQADPKLTADHAFYLGYELAKAVTALTLGKNYVQDQALRWGFLTVPEVSHRNNP